MGKLAHDNEARGSADTVNDAVVLRQFMFLSGEVCLTCDADLVVETRQGHRDTKPRPRQLAIGCFGETNRIAATGSSSAAGRATCQLLEQKSAEAIVAKCLE